MTLSAALVLARFLHFTACLVSFGVCAIGVLLRGSVGHAPLRAFRTMLLVGAAVALVSAILWILCTAGSMAGGWRSSVDPGILKTVLVDTSFGRVWIWRAIIAVALLLLALRLNAAARVETLVAAGALLASIALTGHAVMQEGFAGIVHRVAHALHLLGAGYWGGGLVALLIVLRHRTDRDTFEILRRFSTVGIVAVLVIAASGITNAWFIVQDWRDVLASLYGHILLTKISLFAAMVALACINRFVLMPELGRMGASRAMLQRMIVVEIVLAGLVVLAASMLGTVAPPAPM